MTVEIPKEFCDMVKADIQEIDECLESKQENKYRDLFLKLNGRYQACVKDWFKGMWGENKESTNVNIGFLEDSPESLYDNLKLIKMSKI